MTQHAPAPANAPASASSGQPARDPEREDALRGLLERTGFAQAQRIELAADASTRTYARLILPDRKAILMNAPRRAEGPPCPVDADEDTRTQLGWNAVARLAASRVEAFAAIAAHLDHLGLSAPIVYGVDVEAGWAVLEDLGPDLFTSAIESGASEIALYEAAAEVLAHVHAHRVPEIAIGDGVSWPIMSYDRLALQANADLFIDWLGRYQRADLSFEESSQTRGQWRALTHGLIEQALAFPRALTIRDYHAENLLWLPQRPGLRKVGLLDFQDAVAGWRSWDFAMLLQDARRDVSAAAAQAALARYFALSGIDREAFAHEYAVLGTINALRIIGVFCRLVLRDRKQRYAQFMPRMWAHLRQDLQHPALAELRAFVTHLAPDQMGA